MALQKKVIKQKIATIGNIKKTTKTMEMISAVKTRRLFERTLGVKNFAHYAIELLENLSENHLVENPLMKKREEGITLLIIVASGKGLCGGYNNALSKKLAESIKKDVGHPDLIEAITLGLHAEKIAKRNGIKILASFPAVKEITSPKEVRHIIKTAIDYYTKNPSFKNVKVLHTRVIKAFNYTPIIRRLIPISTRMAHEIADGDEFTKSDKMKTSIYNLEPSPSLITDQIIPELLLSIFFEAILESLVAENGSRMIAMKNASDNADALGKKLKLSFNKARQEMVTNEIAEISGGAEVLSGATLTI